MKSLLVLFPMLAMVAAKPECVNDYSNRIVNCKGLGYTDFYKYDTGFEHAFWKIDLSVNNLHEFPNDLQQFRNVNLSRNSLDSLEAAVDQKVEYLDVSNNDITQIDFGDKFLSLRHLIVAKNYLGLLDDFLEGQCNIIHLDASGNKIGTLREVTKCAQLSILEVSSNKISQVPKELVLLTKLQVLDISRNSIIDVSDLPPTLEILDISFNMIRRVTDSSFRGLSSLVALDISGNSVSSLEKGAFSTLSSLQSLRLRANNLKFVSSELFKGLKSLRGIDLNYNSLASLPNDTFSGLSALETVGLESNGLRTLPALQFGRKVREITLATNSITKMDHSAVLTMFSGTKYEREIFLQLNSFRGDDPEWSNVVKYFDGECSPLLGNAVKEILSGDDNPPHYDKYSLAPSSCSCAYFTKGLWKFGACITAGEEVDDLPWLEAAETYAGIKEGNGHNWKIKKDEF